nr:hypothetical protein [Tanacetum cinerariifolium]
MDRRKNKYDEKFKMEVAFRGLYMVHDNSLLIVTSEHVIALADEKMDVASGGAPGNNAQAKASGGQEQVAVPDPNVQAARAQADEGVTMAHVDDVDEEKEEPTKRLVHNKRILDTDASVIFKDGETYILVVYD